ncbi:glycerophosphocholine phosphodiesterase GPCPD1 isoform X1 [Polypterus senegalus]|uniref:glycerophosphocholine phosphodiesterase GPCPD1 isoform X1 n=1 Tax=Polypterus senegalus TaxID=55291 RepID=UPI001964BF93|nr:glycerophosphocholine phosphodiesterase GPCPD1 isoform X1 [Polypterus senegalus]XP_039594362.1 glycerophosphocholine phosphodiesterase GPCPD1 isoform X1 [Polypterus senegalus]XP_039594363.1 glycerophosphocholine phosphodiesterase GPCPD1 isoform X1 [Polypterus senegalus]
MASTEITFQLRGTTLPGELLAVCGSCEALGNWCPQKAIVLALDANDSTLWKKTVCLPSGVPIHYRYFKGFFLESKKQVSDLCQVIVNKWETHHFPRALNPTEPELFVDDGEFGVYNGVECLDSGWLTHQTEIRLRFHYSEKPAVSVSKKKFKNSRFRVKLNLEGFEDDECEEEHSPTSWHEMTTTLGISLISNDNYTCRHSQPDSGYALDPERWTEYSIHTMDPDNLELTLEFFEEDLSDHVVQGDDRPGHVGTACLLSSSFFESGKNPGIITLPIMSRNSRHTIGKLRVDYIIIRPIEGLACDMSNSYTKYWKARTALDVGHRGAGSSSHLAKHTKIRENTIASFKSAASHGAAFVEFDVHLSKDHIPIVYHDLTCCISMKKKNDKDSMELFEIPVKELSFDQLQLLKLAHVTAMKLNEHKDSVDDEEYIVEHQPFPSLQQIFQALPENVGFNIEIKWLCQLRDGSWEGNLSTYFDMNLFVDVILKCVLQNAGKRRIVFSSFDADICIMVRQKQNKYPILFLTQGHSEVYPEMMDIRCRTTSFAVSFAQSEGLLGINVHTEDLLRNLSRIKEIKSKGLVVFCWGDDTNDHENRRKLREYGIDGLIYDRICDARPEQANIFEVEEQERLKSGIPEETLKSCACSTLSLSCSLMPCPRMQECKSTDVDSVFCASSM